MKTSPILRPQIRLILDSRQVPANRYLSTCLVHSIYTAFKTLLLNLKTSSMGFTLHSGGLDFNIQLQPSRCKSGLFPRTTRLLVSRRSRPCSSVDPRSHHPHPALLPSRILDPLASLATIKHETLSSTFSISPLSEQALQSPAYIDIGVYNFNSLEMDSDVKFDLLDSPNRHPLQT